MTESELLELVRKKLRSEPRLDLQAHPIGVAFAEPGTLIMEGEVADIAAKKLALERAAALPGVSGLIDRLRVEPAQRMGDREILDAVTRALLQEPAFAELALAGRDKGKLESLHAPDAAPGQIVVEVREGAVTLTGSVPGLGHKRLAGVLAWWVPGSRDVINGLEVAPDEPDNDAEITDAVRLVLEKDPFVNADQIQVGTHGAVVTLRGLVPAESEREMAEFDAWYVFGVDRVINEIMVRP